MRVAATARRRFVRALVAIALATGSLTLPAAAAAETTTPTPTPTPPASGQKSGEHAVSVSIAPNNTGILLPGQDLLATVTVTNDGPRSIAAGAVGISLTGTEFADRAELKAWLGPDATDADIGTVLTRLPTPQIPAGEATVLPAAAIPASAIPVVAGSRTQVRGLTVRLTIGSSVVAEGRSPVVLQSSQAPRQTNVSVVMPLTTPPSSDGLIPPDALEAYTGPNGVLTRELDGISAEPNVAIGIDPRILASIRALGTSKPPSAKRWLDRLDNLPNDIFPLSYGDADVAVQAQSGLGQMLVPTSLEYGLDPADFQSPVSDVGETTGASPPVAPPTESPSKEATAEPGASATPTPSQPPPGVPTLQQLVAWPYTQSGIAWPADGTVRAADLQVFAASGLTTTILSSDNVSSGETKNLVSPVLPVKGGTALIADSAVSSALNAAEAASTDEAWSTAMAEAAAQLALISQADTSKMGTGRPGTLLVALDRDSPTTSDRLADTIAGLNALPWVRPITFQQAQETAPVSGVSIKDSPETDQRVDAVKGLLAREGQIANFATVLDDPTILTGKYRANMLALLSVAWRDPPNDWSGAVTTSMNTSQQTLTSVQVIAPGNVNLVGNQATIPITISNKLKNLPVTVVLRAIPSNGRVEISKDVTKKLEANSRATALVPIEARLGNGRVTLRLELFSRTGVPIGGTPTVPVNVQADWEGLGALIIGILVVLLFGFGLVRNLLRRRRAGRADGTSLPEPVEGSKADETDPHGGNERRE